MNNLEIIYCEEMGYEYLESEIARKIINFLKIKKPSEDVIRIMNKAFDLMTRDELMGLISSIIKAPKVTPQDEVSLVKTLDALFGEKDIYNPAPEGYDEPYIHFNEKDVFGEELKGALSLKLFLEGTENTIEYIKKFKEEKYGTN